MEACARRLRLRFLRLLRPPAALLLAVVVAKSETEVAVSGLSQRRVKFASLHLRLELMLDRPAWAVYALLLFKMSAVAKSFATVSGLRF